MIRHKFFKPHRFLWPFSFLYGGATKYRNAKYDLGSYPSYKAELPVISVGNITTGGNGKSPVSSYLAKCLARMGKRPIILNRGYKGKLKEPHLVLVDDLAEMVGDEALMHAKELEQIAKVVVSPDRVLGCSFIAKKDLGDVVLLDDGFQHRRLRRDLDIVLVDVSNEAALEEWKEGLLLPAGPFREDKSLALSRVSCLVAVSKNHKFLKSLGDLRESLGLEDSLPLFSLELYPKEFKELYSGERVEISELKGKRVNGVTAIAKPSSFFSMLEELGISVERSYCFSDHYRYTEEEWKRIAGDSDCFILTTSKDAVKLRELPKGGRETFVLELGVRFLNKEEESLFIDRLSKVVLA